MIELWELKGRDDRRYSLYSWRARMALRHKGLAFESHPVRLSDKAAIEFSGGKTVPVIPPERLRPELLESAAAVIALTGAQRVQIGANRGGRVVAPDHLLAQTLLKCRHRSYLLRRSLRFYAPPGCSSAAAPAASFLSRSGE
jgi:hypothetical protein